MKGIGKDKGLGLEGKMVSHIPNVSMTTGISSTETIITVYDS